MTALAAILLPSPLPAQITFQRTYGSPYNDRVFSIQQTADSGYILTGCAGVFGTDSHDVYLVRTGVSGDTMWTMTLGGVYDDDGSAVQQTTDGGYVVVGWTSSFGAGKRDVYLVKTDGRGDTLWTKTFGGAACDAGYSVQQTDDGGYIVAGFTESFGAGRQDVWLVKTDRGGDTLWAKTYGGSGVDCGMSTQQTADGGFIVAGYKWSARITDWDMCLIKTDADGDTLWTKAYGGAEDDWGYSVQQTADGGYIVAGVTCCYGDRGYDAYLVKTNTNGDVMWTRTFGDADYNCGWSVRQTSDGGYAVVGTAAPFGPGSNRAILAKTDADGNIAWTRSFAGADNAFGRSVEQTADGGYVVGGFTWLSGENDYDAYLIKTDSLGRVGVEEPETPRAHASALSLSCKPNPFRTHTAFSLQLAADSPAELAIFDASGRRVRKFTVNREPYTIWDGTDELGRGLPSGTYFVRLAAAGQHATTRLVLQR